MSLSETPLQPKENTKTDQVSQSGITPEMLLQGKIGSSFGTSLGDKSGIVSETNFSGSFTTQTEQKQTIGFGQNEEENMRFINTRYKIYVFILAIILFFVYQPVWNAYEQYRGVVQEIDYAAQRVRQEKNKSHQYVLFKDKMEIIEGAKEIPGKKKAIPSKKTEILLCINMNQGCDTLPSIIKDDLPIIRSYLQLNTLETTKMEVDEKKILKSINEFLLQRNPFDTDKKDYNGQLVRINIGEPINVIEHLYKVPVRLTITFVSKDDLLLFLENIEKKVFREIMSDTTYSLANTVLYKLDALQYDIMKYETMQDVEVDLTAWYYK